MRRIRTYSDVKDDTDSDVLEQVLRQRRRLAERLETVDRVIAIASGKGGVGKSALTSNLAAALADRGRRVGAVDADLNGPSLARMLGAAGEPLRVDTAGIAPADGAAGVRVISMDLLLASDDAPVRWKRPRDAADGSEHLWQSALETGALREFLADVDWGALDHLLIDVPPGTDKLGRLLELVPGLAGVVLVTTPSEMARAVVARSVRQVRNADVPVVGLAANMTSYICEDCGSTKPLFEADGARRLAEAADVPLWAEVPFDPRLSVHTDRGEPFVLTHGETPAGRALLSLADRVEREIRPTRRDS